MCFSKIGLKNNYNLELNNDKSNATYKVKQAVNAALRASSEF